MSISAADVNKLRQMTGAGLMDCKKALTETNGDFEAAMDYLRKKGAKISANRADREASEGAVIAVTSSDAKKGTAIKLTCETDFVGKNEAFVAFAKEIAEAALAAEPATLEDLKNLAISGGTVAGRLMDEVAKIGEKIDVTAYALVKGENVVSYIHGANRIGVLVELNNAPSEANTAAGKDVAMQIAAMNPIAVDKSDVSADVVAREMEIGREQARAEGKPEAILDKIAQGKVEKFYKESTLLNQEFVKDNSKSVGKMLTDIEAGLTVKEFKRIQLG
ncbi:MAG: elongation factor Ts [Sphingomonadales bacterium]|nr:elongation factor Ts [Sphingomonadales bacterium]